MRPRPFSLRSRHLWRRIRRVYQCNDIQGKSIVETALEYTAKHGLPRVVYIALLKALLKRYRLSTDEALRHTLKRQEDMPSLFARRGFTAQRFFFTTSDARAMGGLHGAVSLPMAWHCQTGGRLVPP